MKVFITGGSKGIGFSIAKRFHKAGAQVGICGRNAQSLEEAAAQLPGIHTYVSDLSQKAEAKSLGAAILRDFGALDVLVNNAGKFLPGKIHQEPDEVFEELVQLNLAGVYYLTKAVLPPMLDARKGTVVNISSIAGIKAYENGGSYGITKYALMGFSRNLREELKPRGIRVVTVMPGAVLTDAWAGVDLPESRFIDADEVAELVYLSATLSARTVVEDIVIRPQLGDI